MTQHDTQRHDTFYFSLRINSEKKNVTQYMVKVDLTKDEDYSTALEKVQKLVKITYPLSNLKKDIQFDKSE